MDRFSFLLFFQRRRVLSVVLALFLFVFVVLLLSFFLFPGSDLVLIWAGLLVVFLV
jgi:hypothetical protein